MADTYQAGDVQKRKRELQNKWVKDNPDRVKAAQQRHRAANRDRLNENQKEKRRNQTDEQKKKNNASMREWRAKNPEKSKAIDRRSYYKDREANLVKAKRYYWDRREVRIGANRAWRAANPDYEKSRYEKRAASRRRQKELDPEAARAKNTMKSHRRRAAVAASKEHYTLEEITSLRGKYGKQCAYCGAKGRMTIDHIIPIAKGGSNGIKNIQFLCRQCNVKKSSSDPIDFARKIGMLV